ncbi:hypothetical protein FNV43_RR01140 [Rhamnella rubrinervis]|uniref:RRM domain-containing protein n=1 Tax=Rhamnella rubrinervis TaxID=2594499 RepID=A0A8K0HQF0_9ROSA|nr:hypothetical protein FNV43_RR01140 [Rhamnella rubrinervis]
MVAFVRRIPGNFLRYDSLPNLNDSASYVFFRRFSSKLLVKGSLVYVDKEYLSLPQMRGWLKCFHNLAEVVKAQVVKKKNKNLSKGYGYVTFNIESDAQKAWKEMNGQLFDGRVVFVDDALSPRHFKGDRPGAREHLSRQQQLII